MDEIIKYNGNAEIIIVSDFNIHNSEGLGLSSLSAPNHIGKKAQLTHRAHSLPLPFVNIGSGYAKDRKLGSRACCISSFAREM